MANGSNRIKINVIIERGIEGNYSAYIDDKSSKKIPFSLIGEGNSAEETIADFKNSLNEMRDYYKDEGKEFDFNNIELDFEYDLPSFLQVYAYAFTLAGLSNITKVSAGQLSHYINGVKRPSPKTVKKIEESIKDFGKEISNISFVHS